MSGQDEDLIVTARVLPENRKVYEVLLEVSMKEGKSPDEINTMLFNAGLFQWAARVSEGLAAGPEAMDEDE